MNNFTIYHKEKNHCYAADTDLSFLYLSVCLSNYIKCLFVLGKTLELFCQT